MKNQTPQRRKLATRRRQVAAAKRPLVRKDQLGNTHMNKKRRRVANVVFSALLLGTIVASMVAAHWLVDHAPWVGRASLGLAFFYLGFRAYVFPSAAEGARPGWLFQWPADLKYVTFAVLIGMNGYWAMVEVWNLTCWLPRLGASIR